jgi:MATE family multidrug resistance protein
VSVGSAIARGTAPATGFAASVRRLAPLAWPVFVGQVSVLAFSTVDTLVVARGSAADLAALGVGSAAYITVFIAMMGAVLAIGPVVGQLFGAGRLAEAGRQVHQAVWIAAALALVGSGLLLWPAPFLALAQPAPEVEAKVRGYLAMLAIAVPAALLFTVYRGFNTAVSRPKAVMVLQLGALAVKVPLSIGFAFGVPALGVPAMGVVGCGLATAVTMWAQVLVAWAVIRRDPFYRPFGLHEGRLAKPHGPSLAALARLGVPMGVAIGIEVTGFTFMAFFIARIGTTEVAAHQVVANVMGLMFMMPLAMGNATGTLVAQRIGAGDPADAHRLGWHGVWLGSGIALALGAAVFALQAPLVRPYTADAAVIAAALPMIAWLAFFHVADAAQTVAVFVLRAHKIATAPVVIYAVLLWGVGIGGGAALAFGAFGLHPLGAPAFWAMGTAALVLVAIALISWMAWVLRHPPPAAPPAGAA